MDTENKKDRSKLSAKLLTKKELDKLFPEGGYRIVGEAAIKGSKKDRLAESRVSDGKDGVWAVLPRKTLGKLWRTVGFVSIEGPDNGWVEIKKSRKPVVIAAAIALLLVAAGVAVALLLNSGIKLPDLDSGSRKFKAPQYERPEGTPADVVQIPGYNDWELPVGTDQGKVPLINPEGNPCYMKFTIIIKDTGEVLYESKLVPPGEAIVEYKFNRILEKGTYDIMIKVDNFSLDDFEMSLNGAEMGTDLIVG